MLNPYVFRIPPVIHMGVGVRARLGPEVRRLGIRRPLVVTGPKVWGIWEGGVRDLLSAASAEPEVFAGVAQEPTIAEVTEGLGRYRDGRCDAVIGFGGGSPMDTAKAVQLLVDNPGDIRGHAGVDKATHRKTPLICLPTTAGTGSEITRYTVITDAESNVKFLISTPAIIPEVAIVDPELTVSMPSDVTASTGMDALTHAIEGFLSAKGQPTSAALALDAIERIGRSLETAVEEGGNLAARVQMSLGQLHAAMAFGNSSVALVHGMARPLGAYFHMPHGLSNAALLPEVMAFTRPAAETAFAEIGYRLDARTRNLSRESASQAAVAWVRDLCRSIRIPSLGEWGIERSQFERVLEQMASDALSSGSPDNNPRKATVEEIVELYERSY